MRKKKENKKKMLVYIQPDTAKKIKLLAILLNTSVSALTEEAYNSLIKSHSDLLENGLNTEKNLFSRMP